MLLVMVLFLALNVLPNGFSRDIACRRDKVRWSPETIRPCALTQVRKHQTQLASRDAFQKFYGIGYRQRRGERNKEVDVIRLYVNSQDFHIMLMSNGMEKVL